MKIPDILYSGLGWLGRSPSPFRPSLPACASPPGAVVLIGLPLAFADPRTCARIHTPTRAHARARALASDHVHAHTRRQRRIPTLPLSHIFAYHRPLFSALWPQRRRTERRSARPLDFMIRMIANDDASVDDISQGQGGIFLVARPKDSA